jgi:hypothetical protein
MPCKGYGVSRFGTPYEHKIYMSMTYFIPCLLSSKFSKTYIHFVQSLLEIHEEIFGFADLIREFLKKFVDFLRHELHFANMPTNTRHFAVHSPFEFNN